MKIKRHGATLILIMLVLFIISAFALLSLRDESFDVVGLIIGGALAFFVVFQYTMMKGIFRHIDRFALLAAQILYSIGMVVLYRLDTFTAVKQFGFILAGSILTAITMLLVRRTRNFGKFNWLFMAMTLGLLLSTLVLGESIYGARNWISLGPISLQPSEFAKILFIMVSAYFFSTRYKLSSFIPYVAFTGVCVMILVYERDLGAGLLFGLTFLIMFFAATGRTLLTLGGVGVLGLGAVASYSLFSHVRTRVEVWQDPWASYNDQGYQIVQGLMALAAGGLFGVGLTNGSPEAIPAHDTDYIFTVIGEEFGIIVAIFVILFYLIFVVRGILIALNARSTYDALLVFGCTAMLALQSFIIIGGVIKLIPLTGITQPFVSYGGSSMLSSMIQLGIIEGVAVKNSKKDAESLAMMGGVIE